jgi:hypothetical protein
VQERSRGQSTKQVARHILSRPWQKLVNDALQTLGLFTVRNQSGSHHMHAPLEHHESVGQPLGAVAFRRQDTKFKLPHGILHGMHSPPIQIQTTSLPGILLIDHTPAIGNSIQCRHGRDVRAQLFYEARRAGSCEASILGV